MSQLITLPKPFTAPPKYWARLGLPTEPIPNPRNPQDVLSMWQDFDFGENTPDAIQVGRASIQSWENQNITESKSLLLHLNEIAFTVIVRDRLDPLLLSELGLHHFTNTSVFTLTKNPVKKQNVVSFSRRNLNWILRRFKSDPRHLPYAAQYALDFCKQWGMPFHDFWIGEDQYIEPREVQKDPVLLGQWRRGFFLLARW